MFYLRTIKLFIKSRPLFTTFYVIFSVLFFNSILLQRTVKEEVNTKLFPEEGRYFHMIVKGDRDYSFLKEKLEDLPGINQVKIVDQNTIGQKTAEVIQELDLEIPVNIKKTHYTGLTVYMAEDLGKRNLELMKEYVARIVGKDNLTTTSIIEAKKAKDQNWLIATLKEMPQIYVVTVLAIIWNLMFFIFISQFKQFSFVFERFQRRKEFGFWGIVNFNVAILSVAILLNIFINGLKPLETLIIFFGLLSIAYMATRKTRWF